MAYICRMPTCPMHPRRFRSQLVQTLHCRDGTLRCPGNTHRSISAPLGTRYTADRSVAPYVGYFDSHPKLAQFQGSEGSVD